MPLVRFAEAIFKGPYTLSIAILPSKRAKVLNVKYRNKSYTPNVLSFPLSKHEGEIILDLAEAKAQFDGGIAKGTWRAWVALLVIHSMLHLNGSRHGRTMERTLQKVLNDNGLQATLNAPTKTHVTTHHHRN